MEGQVVEIAQQEHILMQKEVVLVQHVLQEDLVDIIQVEQKHFGLGVDGNVRK